MRRMLRVSFVVLVMLVMGGQWSVAQYQNTVEKRIQPSVMTSLQYFTDSWTKYDVENNDQEIFSKVTINETTRFAVTVQEYAQNSWQNISRMILSTGFQWTDLEKMIDDFTNMGDLVTNPAAGLDILLGVLELAAVPEFYVLTQDWNGSGWDDVLQIISTVDGQGNLSSLIVQEYLTGAWSSLLAFEFTYDGSDRISMVEIKVFAMGVAESLAKMDITYDVNDSPTHYLLSIWLSSAWEPMLQMNITNDANGNPTEEIMQIRRLFPPGWIDSNRWEKEWNADNKIIRELSQVSTTVSAKSVQKTNLAWRNLTQDFYEWSGENLIQYRRQSFENNVWVDSLREAYEYDAKDLLIVWLKQLWQNNTWENEEQDSTFYNGSDLPVRSVNLSWTSGNWAYFEQILIDYVGGLISTMTVQEYQGASWLNTDRYVYDYNPITSVNNPYPHHKLYRFHIENYPNPFNPSTIIQYELDSPGQVSIVVYDILGQKVKSLIHQKFHTSGLHRIEWNGTDQHSRPVTSGVYFLRVENGERSLTHRCVLMR